MIGPRPVKLTKAQEKAAYAAATERDQGRCVRCGRPGPVDRDHRQNRDAYNTVVSNLQCVGSSRALGGCGCHQYLTEHPAEAIAEGFAVPRWARPETWPAYRFGVGWVIYYDQPDADGKWWREISESTATLLMDGGVEEVKDT